MLESKFQADVIREIESTIPDVVVLKNDTDYIQGVPDLSVIKGSQIAWLECKRSKDSPHQPNQDYYIDLINSQGGFGRFIYPENRKEVLNELYRSFGL